MTDLLHSPEPELTVTRWLDEAPRLAPEAGKPGEGRGVDRSRCYGPVLGGGPCPHLPVEGTGFCRAHRLEEYPGLDIAQVRSGSTLAVTVTDAGKRTLTVAVDLDQRTLQFSTTEPGGSEQRLPPRPVLNPELACRLKEAVTDWPDLEQRWFELIRSLAAVVVSQMVTPAGAGQAHTGGDGSPAFDWPGPLLSSQEQTARTLVPGVVQTVFKLCGPNKPVEAMGLLQEGKRVGLRFPAGAKAENYVSLAPTQPVPTELRNAREGERLKAWIREQTREDVELLDELCWDVFMAGLVTFFKRTGGTDIRERFNFLYSDVFAYRDTKPNHQSPELKETIFERMRYLSSQRLILTSCQPLHVLDAITQRRKLQAGAVHGPAFGWLGDVYSLPGGRLTTDAGQTLQGVRWTLGEWARDLVSNEAYLGQALLKLGRYNAGRQLWERRLGFYLLFQLYNQATSASWREEAGVLRMVAPQQPLYLETMLNGTRMPWQKLGEEHPGTLIRQVTTALDTLKRDRLLSAYCVDGPADGSDLAARGRLPKLLKRRFNVLPGPLLESHLAAKMQVKTAAVQKAAQAREQRQQKASGGDPISHKGRR